MKKTIGYILLLPATLVLIVILAEPFMEYGWIALWVYIGAIVFFGCTIVGMKFLDF